MTTEAEEFKREKERFGLLVKRYNEIWLTRYGRLGLDLRKRSALLFIDSGDEYCQPLFEVSGDSKLSTIIAINDRLELALQGKVKGE